MKIQANLSFLFETITTERQQMTDNTDYRVFIRIITFYGKVVGHLLEVIKVVWTCIKNIN